MEEAPERVWEIKVWRKGSPMHSDFSSPHAIYLVPVLPGQLRLLFWRHGASLEVQKAGLERNTSFGATNVFGMSNKTRTRLHG